MKDWLLLSSDLSYEQEQIVKMLPHKNSLVLGLPGSGKTQVLVHRAAYLVDSHRISPHNIKLFVFTDVLKELVRSEIESLSLPREMVTTFDNWCHSFYNEHISNDLPRVYVDGRVDNKKTHSAVLDALKRNPSFQKSLELVLADDGQDVTPEEFEILFLISRHVMVVADPRQRLYQEGGSESFVLNMLGLRKENSILREDYRSSPCIAQLASHWIEEDKFKQTYLSQVRIEQGSSETPLCYIASSEEKELAHLSQIIQQRQAMKDKVGVFVPMNSLVHRLAKSLADRGIRTEKAIASDAQNVIHAPYDFNNNLPKITTFHMAKGLTFDSVLMPQLTENTFAKIPSSLRRRLLFVGITRASRWVYMSTVKEKEFKEMDTLRSAEKKRHIRILNKLGPFQ